MHIPGLGRLFSRTSKAVEREELVIMIHPTIISNNQQMDDYQREYDAGSTLSANSRASDSDNAKAYMRPSNSAKNRSVSTDFTLVACAYNGKHIRRRPKPKLKASNDQLIVLSRRRWSYI